MAILVICFPVFIIWRTKFNLRQKILLTGVFLLVGFTITVTILRGCTFSGVSLERESLGNGAIDVVWTFFGFLVEYTVCELFSLLSADPSPQVHRLKSIKLPRILTVQ